MESLAFGSNILNILIFIGIIGYINLAITCHRAVKHQSKHLTRMQILRVLNKIERMTGRDFEKFCVYLFAQTKQYKKIELTSATNDGGKDIIMNDAKGDIVFVECKRYDRVPIGREIVQKLVGSMIQNGVKKGIIITTSKLNNNAMDCLNDIKKHSHLQIKVIQLFDIQDIIERHCNDSILKELGIESNLNQTNVCNYKL